MGAWDKQRLILQKNLREIRKKSNLTQEELASAISKPQSYVSKYESGERRIDVIELRAICLACGISLEAFSKRLEVSLMDTRD